MEPQHIHQKWWSSPKLFDDLCLATWSTRLLFSWFPFFISTTTPLHNTVNSLLQSKSHFVNEFTSLWTESKGGSRGRVQGVRTRGFLIQLVFCKKKTMWFAGVEVEQETSAPPPKKILDPPPESLSGHTVVDTTATPRSVSCRQLYSCSLCSSLRYTNSYSRFLHKFQTIGEIQNRKFKISCTNLGWFAQLWSKHSQFQ